MSSVCNAECLANIAWAFVAADRQLSPQEREREVLGFRAPGLGFSGGFFTSAESPIGLLLHSYEVQGSYEGPTAHVS